MNPVSYPVLDKNCFNLIFSFAEDSVLVSSMQVCRQWQKSILEQYSDVIKKYNEEMAFVSVVPYELCKVFGGRRSFSKLPRLAGEKYQFMESFQAIIRNQRRDHVQINDHILPQEIQAAVAIGRDCMHTFFMAFKLWDTACSQAIVDRIYVEDMTVKCKGRFLGCGRLDKNRLAFFADDNCTDALRGGGLYNLCATIEKLLEGNTISYKKPSGPWQFAEEGHIYLCIP